MSQYERRRWQLAATALIVGWALTLGGVVWAASAERERLTRQAEMHTASLDDHEARIRSMERELNGIAADVRWIRRHMEDGRR